jgi:hypothetical protein
LKNFMFAMSCKSFTQHSCAFSGKNGWKGPWILRKRFQNISCGAGGETGSSLCLSCLRGKYFLQRSGGGMLHHVWTQANPALYNRSAAERKARTIDAQKG